MLFTEKKIKEEEKWISQLKPEINKINNICAVGSDKTRVGIIFLLKKHQELCVTNLAKILNVSISAISHQLRLMEQSNLVLKTKMGQIVCYSLNPKSNIVKLFNFNSDL